jgi:hypothetical protein
MQPCGPRKFPPEFPVTVVFPHRAVAVGIVPVRSIGSPLRRQLVAVRRPQCCSVSSVPTAVFDSATKDRSPPLKMMLCPDESFSYHSHCTVGLIVGIDRSILCFVLDGRRRPEFADLFFFLVQACCRVEVFNKSESVLTMAESRPGGPGGFE